MESCRLGAVLRLKSAADLERSRAEIGWIDDDDLRDLESRSRFGATVLGFFTWGGGRLYVGDVGRGLALIGLLIAWGALAPLLPAVLGPIVYTLVGAGAAMWSHEGARAINRFAATRNELALRAGPDPASYRLLVGAATVDPSLTVPSLGFAAAPASGPHTPLIERLRKLAALRHAGVINETELRDRKVGLLDAAAAAAPDHVDDLMFALLPLRDEGVLTPDDFEFVKQLGTGA